MLQNTEDAEAVLQAVFIQIWKKAATYNSTRCSPFTWLVMITRREAIDQMRSGQRHSHETEKMTVEQRSTAPTLTSDSDVALNEQRTAVSAALREITADQRQAIELAFFGGMTLTEISKSSGEPLGTIKARLRSGMLRLHDELVHRQRSTKADMGRPRYTCSAR
jgi:RNA polymerase sigma-70 factor (ECF subfamily)